MRPLTARDAPALGAAVLAALRTYADWAPVGWRPPEPALSSLATSLRGAFGRVADGGHVALVPLATDTVPSAAVPGRAHLFQLVTDRARWGDGLARDLLAAGCADARALGLARIVLWTPREHARARRFYEREGFAATGVGRFDTDLGLGLVAYERAA